MILVFLNLNEVHEPVTQEKFIDVRWRKFQSSLTFPSLDLRRVLTSQQHLLSFVALFRVHLRKENRKYVGKKREMFLKIIRVNCPLLTRLIIIGSRPKRV